VSSVPMGVPPVRLRMLFGVTTMFEKVALPMATAGMVSSVPLNMSDA
jgi:hypothetical protein